MDKNTEHALLIRSTHTKVDAARLSCKAWASQKSNFKAWFTSTATSKNLSDIVGVFGKEPYAFSKVEMKDWTVNEIVVYTHFISQNPGIHEISQSVDDTGLSIEVVILIITNIVTFLISVIGIPVLWFYLKR